MAIPILDWEGQVRRLAPYAAGAGGRVCVTGGPSSAANTFVKIVGQETRRLSPDAVCVNINPLADENMHYAFDILAMLERKLGSTSSGGGLTVASHVSAETVTMEHINVTAMVARGGWEESGELFRRTEQIVNAVGEHLQERRVLLFVHSCDAMSGRTANWFWHTLWGEEGDGVSGFRERGFALICCCESSDRSCRHRRRVASPDLTVRLPDRYLGRDREKALAQATEHIVAGRGEEPPAARVRAETCFELSDDQPGRIYQALPVITRCEL